MFGEGLCDIHVHLWIKTSLSGYNVMALYLPYFYVVLSVKLRHLIELLNGQMVQQGALQILNSPLAIVSTLLPSNRCQGEQLLFDWL